MGRGRLPNMSGREVIRALERGGFAHVGQRGDHVKLRHSEHGYVVIVPLYDGLAAGLMASIRRQPT